MRARDCVRLVWGLASVREDAVGANIGFECGVG